jgi:hypothetical protein
VIGKLAKEGPSTKTRISKFRRIACIYEHTSGHNCEIGTAARELAAIHLSDWRVIQDLSMPAG